MNLREIFASALQIENQTERSVFLDQACSDNPQLRQQVDDLLANHAQLGSFLEPNKRTAESETQPHEEAEPVNTMIGPYRLLEEIGTGGMGVVYSAQQSSPVERRVALKIIKPGMDSRQVLARFEAERQALAIMDHPNIAKVFDAGQTSSGRPYFVMELVNGIPITEFCDQHHLTTRERLELFIPVCMAMQHAHQKGVIHRDLKPSNILVTLYDDKPVPKVIDFGIAKATNQKLTERTLFTAFGHIVGTFEYMSPEQATRNQLDVDTRSDVYSLGVVLYELLTGDTPLDRQRIRNAAWDEALRMIREEEPPLASSKVSSSEKLPSVAANRRTEPAKLSAFIRGELDWIAAKALEKDRTRRYETASNFAEDIRRFLSNEQVLACPPTLAYRLQKFTSKHWKLVSIASILSLTIILGLAGTIWQTLRAMESERAAKNLFQAEQTARNSEAKQRQIAEENSRAAESARRDSDSRLARLYLERGIRQIDTDPHNGLPWLIEAMRIEPNSSPATVTHRLRISAMLAELPQLLGYFAGTKPTVNHQGTQLAIIHPEKQLTLYQLPSMSVVANLKHDYPIDGIYFSQQDDFILTIAGTERGPSQGRVWNSQTGKPLSEMFDLTERDFAMKEVPTAHISPDGQRFTIIWAGMYNRWHSKVVARVFDRASCTPIAPPFAHHSDLDMIDGYQIISTDGQRILMSRGLPATDTRASWVNPSFPEDIDLLQQFDLLTGKPVHASVAAQQDFYDFPSYDRQSKRIATQADGTIKIWNASDGTLVHELKVPAPTTHMSLTFSADGKELLTVDNNRAFLWELGKNEPIGNWTHDDEFHVDPTFRFIIYKSSNGNSYLSPLHSDPEPVIQERSLDEFGRAWFSQDGNRYVLEAQPAVGDTLREPTPSQIFDTLSGQPLTPPWKMSSQFLHEALLSNQGRYLIAIENGIYVWDLDNRKPTVTEYPTQYDHTVMAACRNLSGSSIAILDSAKSLTIYDTNTEHLIAPPIPINITKNKNDIALSENANQLLHIGDSTFLSLLDLKSGKTIWEGKQLHTEDAWIVSAHFLPGDQKLLLIETTNQIPPGATESVTKTNVYLHPCHLDTFAEPFQQYEHTVDLKLASYQGRTIVIETDNHTATANTRTTIRLLEIDSWAPIAPPMQLTCENPEVSALTPDGSRLIVGNGEIWDVATGKQISPALVSSAVRQIMIKPDSREFILVSAGGSSLWSPPATMLRFSIDGVSLGTNMVSPSIGSPTGVIHPTDPIAGVSSHGLRIWDLVTSTPLTRDFEISGFRRGDCDIFFSPDYQRLYSVGDKLAVLNWGEIVANQTEIESLRKWSELLTGKRVDKFGGLMPISFQELHNHWESIRARK
jgi:serine/threonine protein kinase/WD40 repeat protein